MDYERVVKRAKRRPLFKPAESTTEVTIGKAGIVRDGAVGAEGKRV